MESLPLTIPLCSLDAAPPKKGAAGNPVKTGRAETHYAKSLREVARHVGNLISGFDLVDPSGLPSLLQLLENYAETLVPWAQRTAQRMLGEVNDRDRDAWRVLGQSLSRGVHEILYRTPAGERMQNLLADQVDLITSIPTEAGERVHSLTLAALEDSTRAREIAAEISRSGEVAESRAILIARTEVARTATTFTQARCEAIGITHYIWRTAEDGTVRPGHKAMNGAVCEWANPPAVVEDDRILHYHPGCTWNCRCYGEPVLSD